MKILYFLISMTLSMNIQAFCEEAFEMVTEKDHKIILCQHDDLQITQECSKKANNCDLISDLKKRVVNPNILKSSIQGNPGSRICNALGWKVLMAEQFDESQVCTCLHPSGEYISCSSLSDYYQQSSKAIK